jgi:hypothetical protein
MPSVLVARSIASAASSEKSASLTRTASRRFSFQFRSHTWKPVFPFSSTCGRCHCITPVSPRLTPSHSGSASPGASTFRTAEATMSAVPTAGRRT